MVEDGARERPELQLARRAGELLLAHKKTLSVAESCTGGGLGDLLTDIPGSSDYFIGGVIAYAYSAKERALGVPAEMLAEHGAVSPEVARAMAGGVRRLLQTDIAVSITGIAGPGGGTPTKPVGLVYIALETDEGVQVRRYVWNGDRRANKQASVKAALEMVVAHLS